MLQYIDVTTYLITTHGSIYIIRIEAHEWQEFNCCFPCISTNCCMHVQRTLKTTFTVLARSDAVKRVLDGTYNIVKGWMLHITLLYFHKEAEIHVPCEVIVFPSKLTGQVYASELLGQIQEQIMVSITSLVQVLTAAAHLKKSNHCC